MKLYQKTDFASVQSQIGQQLRVVDGTEPFDSLNFYNDRVFNHKIQPVPAFKFYLFVNDGATAFAVLPSARVL